MPMPASDRRRYRTAKSCPFCIVCGRAVGKARQKLCSASCEKERNRLRSLAHKRHGRCDGCVPMATVFMAW
jgi:hypothetical protein